MVSRRFKIGLLFTTSLIVLYIVFAWMTGKILIISLENHIIPAYPNDSASLREVLRHFTNELTKQGVNVPVRVLDETGYDEPRSVAGIAGNGYLFLYSVSDVFDTHIRYQRNRVIISGCKQSVV